MEKNQFSNDLLIAKFADDVAKMARKYQSKSGLLTLDDLEQEGRIGLLEAQKSYDPEKGPFDEYARWCIRMAIVEAIDKDGFPVNVPEKQGTMLRKLRKAQDAFVQQNEREPMTSELAEILGISERKARMLMNIQLSHKNLDDYLAGGSHDDNGDFISFSELVPDTDTPPTDHLVCHDVCYENVIRELDKLSPQEREIFTRCSECNKFTEVADAMGLNRKLVSRTYEKIKTRLRTHLLQSL